jgi:hypothetical protein
VLGFAPHSGWAALVVLGGSAQAPALILRERLELADAALAGSKQPYHALEGRPLPEARRELAHFQASAAALAVKGLSGFITHARESGVEPVSAGILDSAGRSGATLEAILASHALIHTADGEHFRAALASACAELGLGVIRVRLRDLPPRAAARLGLSEQELAAAVSALGRKMGPPWGADQKSAALLAWVLLAGA